MEQREEELQQQMRSLRTKEATLSRTNSELSHRSQQMETRLEVLESELSSAKEQVWLILLLRSVIVFQGSGPPLWCCIEIINEADLIG